jgi:hypothetical protein
MPLLLEEAEPPLQRDVPTHAEADEVSTGLGFLGPKFNYKQRISSKYERNMGFSASASQRDGVGCCKPRDGKFVQMDLGTLTEAKANRTTDVR